MNLSQRFAALLGVFAGVFCGAIFIFYWLQNQELDTAASATAKAQRQQLERALHLHGQHLETSSLDYSLWDELVGYLQNPTDEWIAINITPTLAKFEIDAVWICAADGKLIHSSQRQGPPPAQIPR